LRRRGVQSGGPESRAELKRQDYRHADRHRLHRRTAKLLHVVGIGKVEEDVEIGEEGPYVPRPELFVAPVAGPTADPTAGMARAAQEAHLACAARAICRAQHCGIPWPF